MKGLFQSRHVRICRLSGLSPKRHPQVEEKLSRRFHFATPSGMWYGDGATSRELICWTYWPSAIGPPAHLADVAISVSTSGRAFFLSLEAITWALNQPVFPAARKLILVALADAANRDGECWPSIAALAHAAGLMPRMARKHIQALVSAGLISVDLRGPRAAQYTLCLSGTPVPVFENKERHSSTPQGLNKKRGTLVPTFENKERHSSTGPSAQKRGTPVPKERHSSTAPSLLTVMNRKSNAHVRASHTHASARDAPGWLKTLQEIEPGKLANGTLRTGIEDPSKLLAWAESKDVDETLFEETATYIASAWHGYLRSKGRQNLKATFQNLVNHNASRRNGHDSRPSTGRIPDEEHYFSAAWNKK